jgi:hypothetical protein
MKSKCCNLGVMTPEDYILYNGEDSLPKSWDLSKINWVCAKCGKPCTVEEKSGQIRKQGDKNRITKMKYCCKDFGGFVECDYGYIEISSGGEVYIVDERDNLIFEITHCPFCGKKIGANKEVT